MNQVLIDCERTKYPNTGLFHFCLNLGNELIQLRDNSEEFVFYVPKKQDKLFGADQQYVLQHSLHKFYQPGTRKFQVWHSTYQNSNYRPFNNSTRIVLTVHDLNFLIERKADPASIKKYLQHVQENINRASHIVCISEYTRQTMMEHLQLKDKTIQIIYNGCNINEFPGFDSPVYQPAAPFIFSIGTVLPKKNFHVLPCLLKNNDCELLIAGIINKKYAAKILAEAKAQGVESRVKMVGPITEADKYWYYKNCRAFAFPSLAEGFGLPVVEAMHYGKPVFISTLTSLPEIGGDKAYYFTSFDPAHMQAVFDSGMQHYNNNHMADAIRMRASKFNWTNAARDYLAVYRSLYHQ